jgi:hypothetical protein
MGILLRISIFLIEGIKIKTLPVGFLGFEDLNVEPE